MAFLWRELGSENRSGSRSLSRLPGRTPFGCAALPPSKYRSRRLHRMGQTFSRRRTSTGKTVAYPQPYQRLPNELVIAIIEMVSGELDALRALALVCHSWLYLCRSLIHRTITVDEWGGSGAMPKKKFLRIYTKYPHLCEYVTDVSLKLKRSTKTKPFHPCLLRFSNLRSLHLHSYADPFELPCGVLSLSMITLIPRLLASSRLTRLSLVGFIPPTILDLLRSNENGIHRRYQ
ncbi:hypothetical protein BDN71DRAFT_617589 [Pleurotus eryngii]|uniref:F-box domain-containing protein n=1 Tax=Pleurotus eryngii TaxID=5323 RepID=A0A9P5ZHK5_PLEER|nr:hypothetical protein BDN71DRAFT_617589 [Pleurotus eryngii]